MEKEKTVFQEEVKKLLENKKKVRDIIQGNLQSHESMAMRVFIEVQDFIDHGIERVVALNGSCKRILEEHERKINPPKEGL